MRAWPRLVLVTALLACLLLCEQTQATAGGSCRGGSHASGIYYWFKCGSGSHDGGGPLGPGGGGGTGRHYNYYWLPYCPGALPGVPGAEQMDCRQAHSCADPKLLNLALFSQLVDMLGKPLTGWRFMRAECRDKNAIGPGQPRKTLSWSDIRAAIIKLGLPKASVDAPPFTLVHLRTTFYTHTSAIHRFLDILGYRVEVQITPTTYFWHWGDGTTSTTRTPGRPYPAMDVTHTWDHSTAPGHTMALRVDVGYVCQFRVDGGDWVRVTAELVIAGTTRALPIKQASAVLVPPN